MSGVSLGYRGITKQPAEQSDSELRRLRAERGVAAVGAVAERGVEAEQLPHALAPGAALAVALGEVADEELQAPAGGGVARARRRRRRPTRRPDLRAPLRADVVEAVHRLAQLHVHPLLRALPPPLAPPLHTPAGKPNVSQVGRSR
jgi:hypothetical protein